MSTTLYYGQEEAVQHFIEQLREKSEISASQMKSQGDEFQFPKRTYKLGNDGLYIMPGRYASDMFKNFEDFYGQARKQKVPSGPEIQEADGSEELSSEEVAPYKSLVGSGIYLSQERLDLSSTIKELASSMSTPTALSMSRMKKLIGYLKSTEAQHMKIPFPIRGRAYHQLRNGC